MRISNSSSDVFPPMAGGKSTCEVCAIMLWK
jgi:hypothetical protein